MSEQPIDKRKDLQGAVVVITAGGTGGHVFPALAVASEVRDRGGQVHWLGTDKGIEASAVPREGFELHRVKVGGLRGKGLRVKMKGLLMVFSATAQAMMHLKRLKPIGVLGMGGYVTGPVGVAAWLLRIPLAVHEQNAIAGMTNR